MKEKESNRFIDKRIQAAKEWIRSKDFLNFCVAAAFLLGLASICLAVIGSFSTITERMIVGVLGLIGSAGTLSFKMWLTRKYEKERKKEIEEIEEKLKGEKNNEIRHCKYENLCKRISDLKSLILWDCPERCARMLIRSIITDIFEYLREIKINGDTSSLDEVREQLALLSVKEDVKDIAVQLSTILDDIIVLTKKEK